MLFTLTYEDFEPAELAVCETLGKGCFPQTFLDAALQIRESAINEGKAVPLAEEMVREVYAQSIADSFRPDLTVKLLSFQVKQKYGENQLFEWYYNDAWFGQMAFGLDAASRLYLDKSADELSDAECVLMSAIVNSPMLNPIDSKGALRDFYLSQLAVLQRAGLFDAEKTDELARSNFIIFVPPHYLGNTEPDIITRKALDMAIDLYGREQVERGGLEIITSEDAALQSYLNCVTSVENNSKNTACPLSDSYSKREIQAAAEILQAASVSIAVLDVNTGEILAELQADTDEDGQRSYDSYLKSYPAGGTMNIFAALTAFSGGSSPSTLLWDLENVYASASDEHAEPFHGPVQLREALAQNYQRVLTEHLQRFGRNAVQQNAVLFGLSGSAVSSESDILFQKSSQNAEALAYALIPFSAYGYQAGTDARGAMHPVTLLRVERNSETAEYSQEESRKALIADNLAYLVHDVFSGDSGNFSLTDRPSAVVAGSAEGDPGIWVSGYTTELSSSMHIADVKTISAFVTDGSRMQETAEILWHSLMDFAHKNIPASGWTVPSDISQVRICLPSGKLPTAACRETVTDLFLPGYEPYEYDEYYVEVPVNRENRMLATRYTPFENIVNEIFLDLPDEAAEWAAANGIEQVPVSYDPIRAGIKTGPIQIESPEEFQSFSRDEKINVIIHLALDDMPESMQLNIGRGMYPMQWQEVCNGASMENGHWQLCTLNAADYEPGLYSMRIVFILPDNAYQSAETYFEIN